MTDSHLPWQPKNLVEPRPLFCTGCAKSFHERAGLTSCPDCGERLVARGYCPVCEDYLPQEVGSSCPKHDLPLEAQAPGPLFENVDPTVTWTTVAQYTDSLAAEAPRIRLEAEGIPTFVEGQRMGSRSMYHVATGGVKLKVPDSLASDARVILSQTWSDMAAKLGIEEEWDEEIEGSSFKDENEIDQEIESETEKSSLSQNLLIFLFVGLPALFMIIYMLLRYSSAL
jgi:hypothetical protein